MKVFGSKAAGSVVAHMAMAFALSLVTVAAQAATIYNYSDQGVDFQLTVSQSVGMVTADLKLTADNTGDILQAVSVKLFSSDPPAFTDGTLTSAPAGYTFQDGSYGGGGFGSLGPSNGFVSALHNTAGSAPPGGVSMSPSGTMHTFSFKWTTNTLPLAGPSIKAWTGDVVTGTKSRQWSSGELTAVPEPSTSALLLSLGCLGFFVRRGHRQKTRN